MLILAWKTKKGKTPRFRHHGFYDNAPSHWKKPPGALNVYAINKGDGSRKKDKVRVEDTVWQGVPQSMVLLNPETGAPILDADGDLIDKGLQTVGAERGHWDKDGMVQGREKALTLDEMRDILRKDPDLEVCLTILERTFETFPSEMQQLPWLRDVPALEFSFSYLAKFWCSVAWIEQVRFNFPFKIFSFSFLMFQYCQYCRSTGLTSKL